MAGETNYKNIVGILIALRRKIAFVDSLRGLSRVIGCAIVLFGLLIGLTLITRPSPAIRMAIDGIFILALGTVGYLGIARPFLRRKGLLSIARMLEKRYGTFQTRLIAAIELYDLAKKNRENYSLDLIEKTIDDAGGFIAEIETDVIVDKKPLIASSGKTAVLVLAAVIGLTISPSSILKAWKLYSNPRADLAEPPEFTLAISPGGGEFFRNRDLTINVYPGGRAPRDIDLFFKFDEGDWASEPMKKNNGQKDPVFEYTFKKIQRSLDIYARSGRVKSGIVRLEIVDPPRLVSLNIKTKYPGYSGLPDAVGEPNDGNVAALKGSVIDFTAQANKPLADAYQVFTDSTRIPLKVDGDKVSGNFTVRDDNRYTIMISDEAGRSNPEPIWYDIQALDDYPPSIQIVFPGTDVDLNEQMALPLQIAVSDDYGFGSLNLVWWVESEGRKSEPSKEKINLEDGGQLERLLNYVWDVGRLDPLPGDLIYYYCEVSDNDIISGPKWAKSRTFLTRLPSLDEILAEVDNSRENQINELEEVMKNQEELQKKINDLSREMLKASEVDWEKQQAAKDALEKQKDIAEKMQKLADEMQQNFDKLEENRLMGEQIAEKMQEVQALMEEVATPELKEAMKKLQEALQQMDPEELRKALEDFQLTSKELLENLDRTLSLLKQLAIEQKLDLLTQLAEKILADQVKINEQVNASADSSSLAEKSGMCKNNSDQFNSLKDQFDQLQQMDSELNLVPDKEESDAGKEINNQEIPADFSQMSSSMCQGNEGMCKKKGGDLEKNLRKVAEALKKAQEAMQREMKLDIAEKLQKVAEHLLYLSDRQEKLIDSTRSYQMTEENLKEFAGQQTQLESAASREAETISEISKQTIFVNINLLRLMGELLNNLTDASDHLENKMAPEAINSETVAMGNMNKIVYMLLKAKDQTQGSCSGSGMSEMMQKLGQISQSQSMVNQQTQSLMPMPGMKMSLSQQNSLRKLAGEQEALRKQLQELNDQFGERGEMLGRLDALAEEMKKVVDDLSNSNVGRKTVERQEQILSRLLDAQKSVNRREFSQKRKAEQGEDIARRSPVMPDDASYRDGWLSGIVEKALKENYPRKYDKLIRAYFKSLQNEGAPIER